MSPDSPFIGNTGGANRGGNVARLENWFATAEERDGGGCGSTGRGRIDDDALFIG